MNLRPVHAVAAAALVAAALTGYAVAPGGGGSSPTRLSPEADARAQTGGSGCGSERADVKHLTDGFPLPAVSTPSTPDELVGETPPAVTASSVRQPQERELVSLPGVHVIAAKQEADSDLHVIIATNTGAELNVEAPMANCVSGSPYARELAQARAAMDAALGPVSSTSYTPENVTADVEGVRFFDVLHGQRGAPNGVELHPVTSFVVRAG